MDNAFMIISRGIRLYDYPKPASEFPTKKSRREFFMFELGKHIGVKEEKEFWRTHK